MRSFASYTLAVSLLAASLPGCVERELTVTTVPADAEVFLDGRRLGRSPVTVPFTFYGTREIVARRTGYLPERHLETMEPPYFQEAPEDLYYETLTSDPYRDHREFRYVLTPVSPADTSKDRVEERAADAARLRER